MINKKTKQPFKADRHSNKIIKSRGNSFKATIKQLKNKLNSQETQKKFIFTKKTPAFYSCAITKNFVIQAAPKWKPFKPDSFFNPLLVTGFNQQNNA
jgi:hypothetical protein